MERTLEIGTNFKEALAKLGAKAEDIARVTEAELKTEGDTVTLALSLRNASWWTARALGFRIAVGVDEALDVAEYRDGGLHDGYRLTVDAEEWSENSGVSIALKTIDDSTIEEATRLLTGVVGL